MHYRCNLYSDTICVQFGNKLFIAKISILKVKNHPIILYNLRSMMSHLKENNESKACSEHMPVFLAVLVLC